MKIVKIKKVGKGILLTAFLCSTAQASEMEEIIVQARAVDESVRDIPVSVTAFSEEYLEKYSLKNLEDVAMHDSSLEITRQNSGSGAAVGLRGIKSSSSTLGIAPSVSIIIDGAYYPSARVVNEGLFDANQVAVLKGPQSLYFGKNATAGVITVKTNDPGDELEVIAKAGYEAEFQTTTLTGIISTPISDNWGIRLALQSRESDRGVLSNDAPDSTYTVLDAANGFSATTLANPAPKDDEAPLEEFESARLTLKGDINENTTLTVKGQFTNTETNLNSISEYIKCSALNGTPHSASPSGPVPKGLGAECNKDGRSAANPIPPTVAKSSKMLNYFGGQLGEEYESKSITAKLDMEFDRFTWQTIFNFHDMETNWVIDADFGPTTAIFASENNQFEAYSVESRAATTSDGRLNGVLGLYYQNTERYFIQEVIFAGAQNTGVVDPSNEFIAYDKVSETDGETWSIYGEVIYDITDELQLTAGARFIEEEKQSYFIQPYVNPAFAGLFILNRNLTDDRKADEFLPEVTLRWQPTDNLTIYGAYKEGWKGGGFDNGAIDSALNADPLGDITFEPESVSGFEAGVKAILLNGQLDLQWDLYAYEFEDMQLNYFYAPVFTYRTINAGAVDTIGTEIRATYLPDSVDGLTLYGSANFNDAEYSDFTAPCFAGQSFDGGCNQGGAGPLATQNLKGAKRNNAPKWSGVLGLNYERTVAGDNLLQVGVAGKFKSDYSANEFDSSSQQSGYSWWDASVRLTTADDRWTFALIGKNLTDRYVVVSEQDIPSTGGGTGTNNAYPADKRGLFLRPRTYEFEVGFRL
jgi:iron complex outermembrane receptor protein